MLTDNNKDTILIFGAGALSLGFLGPMLFKNYNLVFCDTDTKKEFINTLKERNEYTINMCSDKIYPIKVTGVTAFNFEHEQSTIVDILSNVQIVFTAVGRKNLDKVMSFIGNTLKFNKSKKTYIFFSENRPKITNQNFSGNNLILRDTIMHRMSRIDQVNSGEYLPVTVDLDWTIIAEDISGIPISRDIYDSTIFKGNSWQVMSEQEFSAWHDLKLLAHNGAHAYLSYLGALRGMNYFYEADSELIAGARSLLEDEVNPAILKKHSKVLDYSKVNAYTNTLISRITNRKFADTISRGIRGSLDKLLPEERLVYGVRFILRNGHLPKNYCKIISAGIKLNMAPGRLTGTIDEIIKKYCGIHEPELIQLIKTSFREDLWR